MQVKFKNTQDDIHALLYSFPFWHRIWLGIGPIALFAMAMLPSLLLIALLGLWAIAAWIGATAYGFIFLIMLLIIRKIFTMKYDVRIPPGYQHTRLTDDFFEVISDHSRSRRTWNRFHRMVDSDDHLVLFISKMRAYIIPKDAFASREEAQQYFDFAQGQINHAAAHPGELPDMANYCADFTPDWASERPQIMNFTCTLAQWARVEFYGVGEEFRKKLPTWKSAIGQLFTSIVFGGLLLISILPSMTQIEGSSDSFFPWVASVLFVIFISIAINSYINWYRYLRWRNQVQGYVTEPTTALFGSQGMSFMSKSIVSWGKWTQMDAISGDNELLAVIDYTPFVHCLIPRTAFNQPDEENEFLHVIQDFHATAKEEDAEDADSDIILAEAVETGNPYQPPRNE
ncbi:MAG: YcxB family protein [Pirellulales bacterium]